MPYLTSPPAPSGIYAFPFRASTQAQSDLNYLAQAIVPAPDGVGTQVIPQGDRFDITGGQRSSNGANLFHSFNQFGLSQGQIANFLSNPQILNILGRVTGGDASFINGKIQISGGSANLFLLNPAGIVFGPNASLNVPGSFTATTASGAGFGCQVAGVGCIGWFNVFGNNNYASLGGTPNTFAFAAQAGIVLNAGNLAVGQGQNLNLLGGTVISTGSLSAPGGQVTLTSVPGSKLVRLSQQNNLLNLEFIPPPSSLSSPASLSSLPFTPKSLPQLLTGGDEHHALGMAVNNRGDIVLTRTGGLVQSNPGTTILAGQVDVSGQQGGTVGLVGDRVGVVGATIQASGATGGGNVLIGGDLQGKGTIPNASRTYISPDSTIHADAVRSGNGGRVIVWADQATEFYGTITARGANPTPDTRHPTPTSNGGFAEVSGKQTLVFRGTTDLSAPFGVTGTLLLDPVDINIVGGAGGSEDAALPIVLFGASPATFTISQAALQSQTGTIVLQAANNITIANGVSLNFVAGGPIAFIADADNSGVGNFSMDSTQTIRAPSRFLTISGANLNLGQVDTSNIVAGTSTGGDITLSARNNITTGAISTSASATTPGIPSALGGDINITAGGSVTTGAITTLAVTPAIVGASASGGDVSLTANNGNVSFASIDTTASGAPNSTGGNLVIVANGVVQGTSTLPGGNTIATTGATQSGSVGIQHNGGVTNLPFRVGSASGNGTVGAINAGGAAFISTGTFPVLPNGGNVTVGTAPNAITITSVNQPPALTINQTLTGAVQDQPFTFSYASFAPTIADANLDQTTLTVTAINRGTLTVNGVAVTPGVTTLSPGDVLVYTPPSGASGLLTSAFSLTLSDGAANSVNSPAQIDVNVRAAPVQPQPPIPPIPSIDPIPQPLPDQPGQPNQPSPPPQSFNPIATVLERPSVVVPTTPLALTSLPCSPSGLGVESLDDQYAQEFEEYLGKRLAASQAKVLEACEAFNQVELATGIKPAIVYVSFVPDAIEKTTSQAKSLSPSITIAQLQASQPLVQKRDSDELELIVVLPGSSPIYRRVSGANRAQVLSFARQLTSALVDPTTRKTTSYLAPAQQLYQWLVQPIAADLQAKKVQNLVFIMDAGLRSLPLAALHDGKGFLIERYSVGLMPSLSLTDTRYRDIKTASVLAMGASKFQDQKDLPAVPTEVSAIFTEQWAGKFFLNENFTLSNLKLQRQQEPFGIIHLATHAEFRPGKPDQSYIQLWDTRLRLDQVSQLGWNSPPVQLLVLSACRTALGDTEAELGFAGIAYQTGVRSVLASLWAIDDEGTLAFMSEFYQNLKKSPIKAEALRQTQLAMLRKQVRVVDGNLITSNGTISLPSGLGNKLQDFSDPFYWATFTLVGNPW